jgi:two-component system phosphate regulon sensor histidine kinase PhoR
MKKRRRLLWQIYPLFLVVTLISVAAVTWYASDSLRRFYLEQTAADLESRGRLLVEQILPFISPVDAPRVNDICKKAGRSSGTRITVILRSGIVIGDSERDPRNMDNHASRPEVVQALKKGVGSAVRHSATLEKNMMYVAMPLLIDKEHVATLRTAMSISSLDENVRLIQKKIVFGSVVIALIIAGISLYLSRRISRPIGEIKQGAEAFAEGNFRHRLPSPDSEEMAGLTDAMNQMASQLDDRIKTIVRQRNELEAVLSSMEEGVIAIDKEEHILSINRAAAEIFALKPEEYQGRLIQEAIRNNEFQRFVTNALSEDRPIAGDIILYQNGERILNAHTTPLRGVDDNDIGILVVLNDVTQLRKLETVRRDFVANVSHELKTPITAIKGFVETLLQGSVETPEETDRFLRIIEKHTDRLTAIIEDLLKLSRLEQNDEGNSIQLEKGSVIGVMQSAIQVCRQKADEKNIQIGLNCKEDLFVNRDAHLLEQAVVNLLDNAIAYSKQDSAVNVEVKSTESELLISVEDNGIGIAKEHLSRLFERFYRVDGARSRKLGGTGLGLSIVKHIIQAHGGYVTVQSTPGKGSVFTIHLPKQ